MRAIQSESMTARQALEHAIAAQPGERLRCFETICGPRGGCAREPLTAVPSVDVVPGLFDGVRRLWEGGESDSRVREGSLTLTQSAIPCDNLQPEVAQRAHRQSRQVRRAREVVHYRAGQAE
jgi:hypothetical protein